MTLTRDQHRAQHAYQRVEAVPKNLRARYKVLVNSLGAFILRDGLAAALAFIERDKGDAEVEIFFENLRSAGIPGLKDATSFNKIPEKARALDTETYMLATRETIRVIQWFKRAVQATFRDEEKTS